MSEAYTKYTALEQKLYKLRRANGDVESPEEDAIIDAMDPLWWEMSDDERAAVEA